MRCLKPPSNPHLLSLPECQASRGTSTGCGRSASLRSARKKRRKMQRRKMLRWQQQCQLVVSPDTLPPPLWQTSPRDPPAHRLNFILTSPLLSLPSASKLRRMVEQWSPLQPPSPSRARLGPACLDKTPSEDLESRPVGLLPAANEMRPQAPLPHQPTPLQQGERLQNCATLSFAKIDLHWHFYGCPILHTEKIKRTNFPLYMYF